MKVLRIQSLLFIFFNFWNMLGYAQQNQFTFEGVYVLENPQAVLVLKSTDDIFLGYISDGQNSYKVIGEMNVDHLRLTMAEGNDKSVNYLALDESGNLIVTDEQLQVIYFTRTKESVDELMTAIEKQEVSTISGKNTVSPPPQIIPSNEKIMKKYANKKFLHLYTGNGFSEKWAYYLYDHGGFYFRSNTSYLSSNAYSDFSSVSSSKDAGKWNIEMKDGIEYLVLNWNSGQQASLQIQKAELGYLLNGTKYYLVGHEEYE